MTTTLPKHLRTVVDLPDLGLPASRGPRLTGGEPCASPGADPEWWFPDFRVGSVAQARMEKQAADLCGMCVSRDNCREWALATGQQHGIWGGLTAPQLAALRRQRLSGAAEMPEAV